METSEDFYTINYWHIDDVFTTEAASVRANSEVDALREFRVMYNKQDEYRVCCVVKGVRII